MNHLSKLAWFMAIKLFSKRKPNKSLLTGVTRSAETTTNARADTLKIELDASVDTVISFGAGEQS